MWKVSMTWEEGEYHLTRKIEYTFKFLTPAIGWVESLCNMIDKASVEYTVCIENIKEEEKDSTEVELGNKE